MWTDALVDGGRLLLLLDFDGTLVPIAPHPEGIVVPPELPSLLGAVKQRGHAVWIVSGRRAGDVSARVEGAVPVVGLHGLEWPGEEAPARHPKLDALRARAEREIASDATLSGAHVEDKGRSVALHYRGVAETQQRAAGERLTAIAREEIGGDDALNVLPGHCIVEVRPREASKGNAVRRLVELHPDKRPVYVGDDVTDEEAFAALGPTGLGVRVSAIDVDTRAALIVHDVEEVLRGLRALAHV